MDKFNIEKLKNLLKNTPKHIWVLFLIVAIGIFLRTYNLHDWLNFASDQSRDVILVSNVVNNRESWPLLGPTMRKSEDAQGNLFHVGPIYYYFQIVSAEMFSLSPEKMAYPDIFFSILLLPLLYILFRKFFDIYLSLALTGLATVSLPLVQYSRFAWNPNPIPFFVILLLLSAYEILTAKEKAHWLWFLLFGVAFGVGVQLHVIILVIFSLFTLYCFWMLRKKSILIWKKMTLTVLVIFILNAGQIISEVRTGLGNTRTLINSSLIYDTSEKSDFLKNIGEDIDCHFEANAYMLSGHGSDECDFSFVKMLESEKSKKFLKDIRGFDFWLKSSFILVFSVLGYGYLIFLARREKDEKKKIFLKNIIFYAALSFFVMFPAIDESTAYFRYFNHVFFVPLIILGIFSQFLIKRKSKKYTYLVAVIFAMLAASNLSSIKVLAGDLSAKRESDLHNSVLGEMELMVKYIRDNSDGEREAYLVGDDPYVIHFFQGFYYIAQLENFDMRRVRDEEKFPSHKPLFYIAEKNKSKEGKIKNREVDKCENVGKIIICKLKN